VLRSQSRAHKHPVPRLSQFVIDRLLEIRSAPPAPINRIPGPKTLRYYLEQDPELRAQARSTRTIWQILRQYGRIADGHRDPRFVGAAQQRDFPAPFVRFWLCLGVMVTICPPRRPDLNAFVERCHRSFEYECLRVYQPADLETATAVTLAYQRFYNEDRPDQGLSCGNLPPRVAFSTVPPLPPVPAVVDADRWLDAYDGHVFARKVLRGGLVLVGDIAYYVKVALVKQHVALRVDAKTGVFVVEADGHDVQRIPIKGVGLGTLPFTTLCGADQYRHAHKQVGCLAARSAAALGVVHVFGWRVVAHSCPTGCSRPR